MKIALIIGLVFVPLAALMVFLITYNEYIKHYPDRRTPLKHALGSAFFAFLFFILISVLIGLFLPRIANKQ